MRLLPAVVLGSIGVVFLFQLSSCSNGGDGGSGGSEEKSDSQTTTLTPSVDEDGAVTAAVSAASADTLILNASAGSSIEGASVTFPPGTLAVDVDVTIEPGISLDVQALESDLGLAGVKLDEASGAVVVSSNPATNALQPFTIALQLPSQALAPIDLTNLVVIFKMLDAAGNLLELGVIPKSDLTIEGLVVKFQTLRFGVFQAMVSSAPIAAAIKVKTTKPIETVRDTKKNSGGGDDGGGGETKDTTAPVKVSKGPAPGIILKTTPFRAVYNEGINLKTVQLFGDLKDSAELELAKTSVDNDTLVIKPKATWPVGGSKNLTVVVKDASGNAADQVGFEYEIVDKLYYVRGSGNNSNDGSATAPWQTIGRATPAAQSAGGSYYIFVAEGTYTGNVVLDNGTRLLGGFPADSWSTRDAKGNETIIDGTSPVATFSGNYVHASNAALLKGFTVRTGDGFSGGPAIRVDASSVMAIIEENYIHWRFDLGGWGIQATSSPVRIVNNVIQMDPAAQQTEAIKYTGTAPLSGGMTIARNTIYTADVANQSVGTRVLYLVDSDGTTNGFVVANVHDNVIRLGPSQNVSAFSVAVFADNVSLNLRNNTIYAHGQQLYALHLDKTAGGTPTINIENNIFDTAAPDDLRCIKMTSSAMFTSLKNNVFRGCVDATQSVANHSIFQGDAGAPDTIAQLNTYSGSDDNIDTDPGFALPGSDDFHIGTAAVKNGGLNGKNLGWTMFGDYADREGTPRGNTWSIGAYQ